MCDSELMNEFLPSQAELALAVQRLAAPRQGQPGRADFSGLDIFPQSGVGSTQALKRTAEVTLDAALNFADRGWFAHMDPPTPWVTWACQAWMAALNQNLLHPDTGLVGRQVEESVIDALAPHFGMDGGHMVPGSTLANLTALWAARDLAGAQTVVASELSHLSIRKAAHILGVSYRSVPCDETGCIDPNALGDLKQACLVLTAGTTSTGSIDPLEPLPDAAWVHVDAAWAGPLRLSQKHAPLLAGLEDAQSVAVSAHKWLWQPKDSALILFADSERAHEALSFGGTYLSVPNVGVLGSSAARAIPLAATLMAFGRDGIARRLDACMALADRFAGYLSGDNRFELWGAPQTGVIAWRSTTRTVEELRAHLAEQGIFVSQTTIGGEDWLRSVAVHPGIDVDVIYQAACTQ
ncbi:MAG: pyridoxal-dependent decarboxylase [Pseudomonadota bacterium]